MEPPPGMERVGDTDGDRVTVSATRRLGTLWIVLGFVFISLGVLNLKPPSPPWVGGSYALLGVAYLVLGVVHRPVRLTVDDHGLELRSELGRVTEIAWADVTSLELERNWQVLRVTAPGGIRRGGRLLDRDTHRFRGFSGLASTTSRTLDYLRHRHARALADAAGDGSQTNPER